MKEMSWVLRYAMSATLLSCGSTDEADAEAGDDPEPAAAPNPARVQTESRSPDSDVDQPVESPSGCDDAWVAEVLPKPWWLSDAVTDELSIKHHTPVEAYDGCTANPAGYNPDACGLPHKGARICVSTHSGGEGRVTSTCLAAKDCPESMVCVGALGPSDIDEAVEGFGRCEKTCGSEDPKECVRDDMWCDVEMGICRPLMPKHEGNPYAKGEGNRYSKATGTRAKKAKRRKSQDRKPAE